MQTVLTALKAAAEPTRLRLLALCARSDLTVGELALILGQSQPRISRHLKLLAAADLLERLREGSRVFYRLARGHDSNGSAEKLLSMLPESDPQLELDQDHLAEVHKIREGSVAAYRDRVASQWEALRSLHADEGDIESALAGLLPESGIDTLLDIGTGTGRMLEIFAPRVGHAQGVDVSSEMLTMARCNVERPHLENCAVRKADMYQLPFPTGSFDAITIHQVLHFADDPARVIAEAARVLRSGGCLLIGDFAPHGLEYLRRDHDHRRLGFNDEEIASWFANTHLEQGKTVHLPGDPLTVVIWQAAKPGVHALGNLAIAESDQPSGAH